MEPQISVIIVNWNGKHHLEECLSSLNNQTFKNFEIIFVDNGSDDGSVEFVAAGFSSVKIIKLIENKGFCAGNNIGLQHAKGKFIACLNNDTQVDECWLQELNNAMLNKPDVGICASCMVNYFDRSVIDTAGDGYDICGVGFKIGSGMPVSKFQESRYVFGACAGAALYRRSMLEKIGFFDEDYFAMGEDIDLSFRAVLSGFRCFYVSTAIVYHKINQTIGRDGNFLIYHARRNVEYTYFKNMPFFFLPVTLPFHLIYEIFTALEAISAGKIKIFIRSKIDLIKIFPNILKKRRYVQNGRAISHYNIFRYFTKDYLMRKLIEQGQRRGKFIIKHQLKF